MTSAFTYQMKAARSYGRGDYKSTIEHCRKMIEIEGDSAFSHYMIATCHELNENFDKAISSAEYALECDEKHFDSLEILSRIYFNRKEYEKTKEYVVRGLEAYPEPLPKPPKFFFTVLRLLSFIPKLRHVYKQAQNEITNPNRSNENWFHWAKEYLEWYEGEKGEKFVPTLH